MGNSNSSNNASKRSAPADAGSNLLWAIEQMGRWEERVSEDEEYLQEQLTMGNQIIMSQSQGQPSMQMQSSGVDTITTGVSQFEIKEEFPHAGSTTITTDATSMGIGTSGVSTGAGLDASSQPSRLEARVPDKDELFLLQKFHFAYEALQHLVAGAEHNYRLVCRHNLIRDVLKNEKQPVNKLVYEKKIDSLNGLINRGLGAWDHAAVAVGWLQKDYGLALRWVKLSRRLASLQAERNKLELPLSQHGVAAESDANMKNMEADRKRRIDSLLQQSNFMKRELENLSQQIALHQKDSLSIGLLLLDKNMSGAIEADDVPDLQSELFATLDIKGRHRITTDDLQRTVDGLLLDVNNLDKELRQLETEINQDKDYEEQKILQLQAIGNAPKDTTELQNLQADMFRKKERYSAAYSELQQKRRLLDQLYTVFGQSFIRDVMKRLETPTDMVVGRVSSLLESKKLEDRGMTTNYSIERTWQPSSVDA